MAYFDRFDICEAYLALETDYNVGGWLRERPSNQRRREAISIQLKRIGFQPGMGFNGFRSLSENGQEIYLTTVKRLGLPSPDLTPDDVEIDILLHEEYEAPENCFASGDANADRETVEWIRSELERGSDWAWCTVEVKASCAGYEASAFLGACSYQSEREFKQDAYFKDLCQQVIESLQKQIMER